jgi:hypothetical protein
MPCAHRIPTTRALAGFFLSCAAGCGGGPVAAVAPVPGAGALAEAAETADAAEAAPPASATPAPGAGVWPAPPGRVVAVGDLHGDPAAALAVLSLAGVVDAAGAWSGGDTALVLTGDWTDRGPSSRGVLALLRRLEGEAAAAGGRVVGLLGNHEAMNLTGDWRYVSPADVADYGGEAARRAAYAPGGADGDWLRAHGAVAQVGETAFAHGGFAARWAPRGVPGLNALVAAALAGGDPAVLGEDGPLWYRGHLLADEAVACAEVEAVRRVLGVRRIVVGHTTQRSGEPAVRCGGALIGIDTGISAHYGGHLAALELRAGTDAWALLPAGPRDLPDPPPPGPAPAR